MGETKKKSISLQEKIDIFTRYFEEGNEGMNGKTVFEGYPIGAWAMEIRTAINKKKNTVRPTLKQLKQLFSLGILESQIDSTIDQKIEALVDWKAKNPEIIIESRTGRDISETTIEKLRELATKENIEYDELLKRYEKLQGYRKYVWARESRGRLTKPQIEKCKEGGLGGKFGLPSAIEEIANKYNIEESLAEHIYKKYGSVEEVINKYRNGELSAEDNERFKGILIDTLVNVDKNPNSKRYGELLKEIFSNRDYTQSINLYSSKKIDEVLRTLAPREENILRRHWGLGDGDIKSYKDLAEEFNVVPYTVSVVVAKALRKLRHPEKSQHIRPVSLQELKASPYITEEEKRKVIKIEDELWKSNLVVSNNEQRNSTEVDSLELTSLIELTTIIRNREQEAIIAEKKDEFGEYTSLEHLELSARSYNCLRRGRINSLQEILEMKMSDFVKLRNLGKGSRDEIISKVEEYGYVFNEETGFEKIEEPLIEQTQEDKTDIVSKTSSIRDIYGLTPKTYDILEQVGITSLEKLTSLNINKLASIKYFRSDSYKKLIAKLQEMGYTTNENGDFVYTAAEEQLEIKTPEGLANTSLSDMGFSDKIYTWLRNGGVTSLQDIAKMNEKNIRSIGNIGDKTFDEIVGKMQEYGYSFTKGSFVYRVNEEEKLEQINSDDRPIEYGAKKEEICSRTTLLQEMKEKREELEQQLAELEKQTTQARALLAEYDKIIGDSKIHTEEKALDFKDE